MPTEDDPHPTPARRGFPHRRPVFVGAMAVAVAIVISVGLAVIQTDEPESIATSSTPSNNQTTTALTAVEPRTEVAVRLQRILEVRDRAISNRDADLLDDIYTVDCECLTDGRSLIEQLRKENVIWRGLQTSLVMTDTEEVNDRLWIIVADVSTPSIRVETESGRLIRIVPAERNRVRFALAKPRGTEEWLLGHASALNEGR